MERKPVTVTVFEADEHCEDEPHVWPMAEFMAILEKAVDAMPEQHRATATVGIKTNYESAYASLLVRYTRPQTDEEVERDRLYTEARARETEERDRRQLERLKAKLGEK